MHFILSSVGNGRTSTKARNACRPNIVHNSDTRDSKNVVKTLCNKILAILYKYLSAVEIRSIHRRISL